MPSQNDLAALIDGGLNRWDVNVWVARSHDHSLRGCACRPCQGGCESCDESPYQHHQR
jgi:hypothetical protein